MKLKLKNNCKNIINIICLVCYVVLLLYTTLIGREHTNPFHAVFEGWLPFRRYDGIWNLDTIYNIFLLTPITFLISKVFVFKNKERYIFENSRIGFCNIFIYRNKSVIVSSWYISNFGFNL